MIRVARLAGVMGALLVAVQATDVRAQVAGGAEDTRVVGFVDVDGGGTAGVGQRNGVWRRGVEGCQAFLA